MRTRLFTAAIVAAILLALPAVASAKCKTLKCEIPSADGVFVGGPKALDKQKEAGFYDFTAPDGQGDYVAYVIPSGQRDQVAPSVAQLPVVQAANEFPEEFQTGTITVFGPEVSMYTSNSVLESSRARRTRARSSQQVDSFGCYDMYFCIYSSLNFNQPTGGRRLQFHDMGYWQNLSAWAFNDQADSMRNRRDRDSWLAEHGSGGGDRHCYDSHSSDGDLSDPWPWQPAFEFGDDASSTYNSYGDTSC